MIIAIVYDGEFSGPSTRMHAMVALGAVVYDTDKDEVLSRFMSHIAIPARVRALEHKGWEPDTVKFFWQDPEKGLAFYQKVLAAQADPATPTCEQVGAAFVAWADAAAAAHKGQKFVLVSDTAGSDFSWLETILPPHRAAKMLFGGVFTPSVCCSNFYLGIAGVSPNTTLRDSEKHVLRALELDAPVFDITHDHDPSRDAEYIARFYGLVVRELERREEIQLNAKIIDYTAPLLGPWVDTVPSSSGGDAPFYLLAVDVETAGRNHTLNFMTRIGARLILQETGAVCATFRSYLAQPAGTQWERRCIEQFWLKHPQHYRDTKLALRSEPPPPSLVMSTFVDWARNCARAVGVDNLVVVSDTAGFDVGWLDHCMPDGLSMLYLFGAYKPVRDVTSFYLGVAHSTPRMDEWNAEEAAHARLGIPYVKIPRDHAPENDARAIGTAAANVFNHLEACAKRQRLEATAGS